MPFVLTHAAHRVSLKNRRPSLILAKGCQIARPFDCCSFAFSFLLGATGRRKQGGLASGAVSAPSPPTPATSPAAGAEGEGESTAAVHTSLDRLGLGVVWVLGVDYGGGALIREWRR